MIKRPNLRKRIMVSLVAYTVALTFAVGLHGFLVNEEIEKLVWENVLDIDFENLNLNKIREQNESNKPSNLLWFDQTRGDRIPAAFAELDAGIHDEIEYANRIYVIKVTEINQQKQLLAMDITELEQQEFYIVLSAILLTLVAVALLTWFAYRQLGRLINPMLNLAQDLSAAGTIQDQIKFDDQELKYYESYMLNHAIRDYVEKSQQYLEKESSFFATASHELRTPIAVISGAIEVIKLNQNLDPNVEIHLNRIARVTAEMEELTVCLLFLARDKDRLAYYSNRIDLAAELPSIIAQHQHLLLGKKLSIDNQFNQPLYVNAPEQLIKVTLANLIRNAIENSDVGEIKIYQQAGQFIIEDPGHGMTAEELSQLYTLQARRGENKKGGIGLPLILKICDLFDWQLSFQSKPEKGTIATLDFTHAAK